jgi:hypothetical protein
MVLTNGPHSLSAPGSPRRPISVGIGKPAETADHQRCAGARPAMRLAFALAFLLIASLAWGQTPTLVQHYYTGANSAARGLTAASYTFRLPNKVLAGNALVMFIDYPSGTTIRSISDDGSNNWPTAAATVDANAGNTKTSAYVLPNAASGTRVITVTFSDPIAGAHAVFLEYYNVSTSSPVGLTTTSATPVSPSIQPPSFTPTSGNLVLNYVVDNNGTVGGGSANNVGAWAAGSSQNSGVTFTALGGDINNTHDTSPHFMQSAVANGSLITPTATATQTTRDTFTTIAIELRGASAGTAPGDGIRILKQQFFTHTALTVPGSWTEFFPAQGNLLVGLNIYPGSSTSAFTDSKGNAWSLVHANSGAPMIVYAENPNVESTLMVTFPLTNENSNTTITLYDIVGAATSSVLAQSVTVDWTDASNLTVVNSQPSITPQNANGLIIALAALGQGPATGMALGAPASALFMPVTYPGETDFDTFNNADSYGHSNYGTSLTNQTWNWTIKSQSANSIASAAAEFKAAGAQLPQFPLTVFATGTGAGTVSSMPTGIDCGTNCSANFVGGSSILLTATPAAGSLFTGWSGGGCAGTGTCTVTLVTSTLVTATFTLAAADTTPPSAPAGLTATAASASQINLSWTASTDNVAVTGYRVERCQVAGCATFALIAILTGTTTTFADNGLLAGTSYGYRVRATDLAGNLSAFSNTSSATTPSVPGMLAGYAFAEGLGTTTADASGSGITGTLVGPAWVAGKNGTGLSFNGSSAYVDLGTAAALGFTGSMTLSAWVYETANVGDDGQIVAKSDGGSGWQLKSTPDTGTRTFGIAITNTSGGYVGRYSSTVRALNTWYHVAGVYDAAAQTLNIYVNGVLNNGVLFGTVPTTQRASTVAANIGRRTGGFNIQGIVDDVRVYGRALSAAEIQADMATPVGQIPGT